MPSPQPSAARERTRAGAGSARRRRSAITAIAASASSGRPTLHHAQRTPQSEQKSSSASVATQPTTKAATNRDSSGSRAPAPPAGTARHHGSRLQPSSNPSASRDANARKLIG